MFSWEDGGGGWRCSETAREGEAEDEFVCTDLLVILLYNYHQHYFYFFKDRMINVVNKVKLLYNTYTVVAGSGQVDSGVSVD